MPSSEYGTRRQAAPPQQQAVYYTILSTILYYLLYTILSLYYTILYYTILYYTVLLLYPNPRTRRCAEIICCIINIHNLIVPLDPRPTCLFEACKNPGAVVIDGARLSVFIYVSFKVACSFLFTV